MLDPEKPQIYQFDEYRLDLAEESLRRNGEKVAVNRRTFQVLKLLVERAGEIVGKQEFFEIVWADTFVEDNVLTVTMTALRKALGDNPKQPKFIENLPRKGYRFVAEVEICENQPQIKSVKTKKSISDRGKKFDSLPTNRYSAPPKTNRIVPVGIVGVCLLILFAVVGFNYSNSSPRIKPQNDEAQIESIAVLPFENQNPDTEYLSDGMTESLINGLSELSNLRVISRNSAFQYKGKSADSATIGRELNVRTILSGRIVQNGDDLIVSAELIDTRDNKQIWGRRYNRQTSDVLNVQQEISRELSAILRSKLTSEENRRLAKRATDSPEAFQFYLKGQYQWNKRTGDSFIKAVEFYKQAIESDPTFALAYVGLANCYLSVDFKFPVTREERVAMVKAAANKALEIDPKLSGEVHATLAINSCFNELDWENADREYKLAIELSPNYATAHHWYAEFLAMEGRFDESFAAYQRALELDPLSLAIKSDLGFNYYYAHQFDRAIDYLEKLKLLEPKYSRTYIFLGKSYEKKGMFAEAIVEYTIGYNLIVDSSQQLEERKTELEKAVKTSGAKGYWQKGLELTLREDKPNPVNMAKIYSELGENDKAFELLEKAYNERSGLLVWLKVSPEFDNIRADPRFPDLVRRVGLSQ